MRGRQVFLAFSVVAIILHRILRVTFLFGLHLFYLFGLHLFHLFFVLFFLFILRRRHRRHRRRVLIHITRRLHAARGHTFLSAFRVRAVERTAFRVRGRQVRRARAARRAPPFRVAFPLFLVMLRSVTPTLRREDANTPKHVCRVCRSVVSRARASMNDATCVGSPLQFQETTRDDARGAQICPGYRARYVAPPRRVGARHGAMTLQQIDTRRLFSKRTRVGPKRMTSARHGARGCQECHISNRNARPSCSLVDTVCRTSVVYVYKNESISCILRTHLLTPCSILKTLDTPARRMRPTSAVGTRANSRADRPAARSGC